jgi:hypothetical protein
MHNLKFVTFTLDRKVGLSPAASRHHIVDVFSEKFKEKLYYECRKRGLDYAYVAAVEVDEKGYAHLHLVGDIPLSEAIIRTLWFRSGGGIVCDVEDINSIGELEKWVGYTLKEAFARSWDEDNKVKHHNAILASNGLGYYSAAAKAERKRHVPEEPAEQTGDRAVVEDWTEYAHRLEDHVGAPVVLEATGEVGRLRGVECNRLIVQHGEETDSFDPREVIVEDPDVPLVLTEVITPFGGRKPRLGTMASSTFEERWKHIKPGRRTTRYVHEYRDGRRVLWRFDWSTQKMVTEPLDE